MAELPKSRFASGRAVPFVAIAGGSDIAAPARPPAHLGLRRAAEIVEGAAYDLAGKASPVFISRLIEIAAELDRHARSGEDRPAAAARAAAAGTVVTFARD